ncbi:hypothetical protein WJX84_011671 [Apatococcus fuscideae]|uniref:TauD/TfdA-like domain-containing protein n=1 Tax=Apatococcus fuscideae TaxID=2026836 RepID=A0AAW1SHY7_9CHLO
MAPAEVAISQTDSAFENFSEAVRVFVRHSGPQGKVKPLTIIDHPSDWTSASLKGREQEYTYQWTAADTQELDDAVKRVQPSISTEDDVLKLSKADFHLPQLSAKLVAIGKEVTHGRGFHLVKGFPIDIYRNDLKVNPGHPKPAAGNNVDGNSQGDKDFKDPGKSLDKNREFLPFHSDQGATDLIALLSLTAAPKGGESKWVSSLAIHNELLRQGRKDLVEALSAKNTWFIPRKYDQATWERTPDGQYAGYEEIVPFEYHDGYLSVYFNNGNFHEISKQLSPIQEEAIWAVAKLAEDPEFHFSRKLEPGDLELIHNPTMMHSRSDVYDGETPLEKRHLLRWWVHSDANDRPIAPTFAPRSSVRPEGGFKYDAGTKLRLPFFPYSRHDGEGQSPY